MIIPVKGMKGRVQGLWGGYGQYDRFNHRSLLQNSASFVGLFCKRDL